MWRISSRTRKRSTRWWATRLPTSTSWWVTWISSMWHTCGHWNGSDCCTSGRSRSMTTKIRLKATLGVYSRKVCAFPYLRKTNCCSVSSWHWSWWPSKASLIVPWSTSSSWAGSGLNRKKNSRRLSRVKQTLKSVQKKRLNAQIGSLKLSGLKSRN